MKLFLLLRDWSEVWALLIPLIVILVYKPKGRNLKWLFLYVVLAFILNFLAIFMVEYKELVPAWLSEGNNVFYNLHSFIMVTLFSFYIITIRAYKFKVLSKGLLLLYLALVIVNFTLWESPLILSTRHFTAGSIVLLIMCLTYFFSSIMEESKTNWLRDPSFIICVGVLLYEVVTFFIFLSIYPLFNEALNKDLAFAYLMMRVYQGSFVVFCILLAIGLYNQSRKQKIRAAE